MERRKTEYSDIGRKRENVGRGEKRLGGRDKEGVKMTGKEGER